MFKLYFCLCFKCIYSYYLSTFIEIDTRHKLVCLCVILFHFQGGYALFTFFSLLCFCSLSSLVSSSLFPIHSCLSSSSLFIYFLLPPLHFCPFLPFLFFPPSREGSVCFLFILVGGNDSSLGLNPKQPYGKRAQFAAVLCVCAQKHAKIFRRFKEWSVCEKPG